MLLVDDVEDNRENAELLGYSGFEVDIASDGAAALRQAQTHRPDVIVMDLAMTVMHGWEACRRLKADPGTQTIPIIALTARVLNGAHIDMPPTQSDSHLTKPCLPQDLLGEIQCHLERPVAGRVLR
jgi:CheY-like chemotaxis protein